MAYIPSIPYSGSQVLIASERVHLHAKTDSVVLTGAQSVALSSIKTVNLDAASGVILHSPSVKLGSVNAQESLILGDTHVKYLKDFLDQMKIISLNLQSIAAGKEKLTPELAAAMVKIANFGSLLSNECDNLKNKLSNSLSETCKCV